MKYIKNFETLLKHTDKKVLEHKFKPFAEKLKSLLTTLQKCDDLENSTVRIYYDSYGEIKIIYNYKYIDLYTFRLITRDIPTGLELTVISSFKRVSESSGSSKILHKMFDTAIKKYENDWSFYYPNSHDIPIPNINDLSVLDKIYNDVYDKFEYIVAAKKYNL